MEKILISACLLGAKVNYRGQDSYCDHPLLKRWINENRLISICPEVKGGASIPRSPAEIIGTGGGLAVIMQQARIKTADGTDVTEIYKKGAEIALQTAQAHHIKIAILKEGSPSCGTNTIYDGNFSRTKIIGMGITVALFRKYDIAVFSEDQLEEVDKYLRALDPEYKN